MRPIARSPRSASRRTLRHPGTGGSPGRRCTRAAERLASSSPQRSPRSRSRGVGRGEVVLAAAGPGRGAGHDGRQPRRRRVHHVRVQRAVQRRLPRDSAARRRDDRPGPGRARTVAPTGRAPAPSSGAHDPRTRSGPRSPREARCASSGTTGRATSSAPSSSATGCGASRSPTTTSSTSTCRSGAPSGSESLGRLDRDGGRHRARSCAPGATPSTSAAMSSSPAGRPSCGR